MDKILNKNNIVTKSNFLVQSHYALSLEEQRLIIILASMVQPNDSEFKVYTLRIKDINDFLGIKTNAKYEILRNITKKLIGNVFEVINQDGTCTQVSWLSSATYKFNGDNGTVTLSFDNRLKPYMLNLKKYFMTYRIKDVLGLKSKYAMRLYEILKSYCYKNQLIKKIELKELKNMLGIKENEYKRFYDLDKRVLKVAEKEINAKTNINFSYDPKKVGRYINEIEFTINIGKLDSFEQIEIKDIDNTDIQDIQNLISNITALEAEKILSSAKGDFELIKEKYLNVICKMSKVPNVVAYTINAIKEDWKEPKVMSNNNTKLEGDSEYAETNKDLIDEICNI